MGLCVIKGLHDGVAVDFKDGLNEEYDDGVVDGMVVGDVEGLGEGFTEGLSVGKALDDTDAVNGSFVGLLLAKKVGDVTIVQRYFECPLETCL